jgi:hypothetical protein
MMKNLETIIKRSSRNWEKKEEKIHSDLAQKRKLQEPSPLLLLLPPWEVLRLWIP